MGQQATTKANFLVGTLSNPITFLVDVDYFFSRCRLFFECQNRDRQIKMYKNSAYIIGVRIYSLINIMEVKLCTYVDVKNISVVGLAKDVF